jgi:hypothetical protein
VRGYDPGLTSAIDVHKLIVADLGFTADRKGRFDCPFCLHEESTILITPDRRTWECYACGEGGDAVTWVSRRMGVTEAEAARLLIPNPRTFRPDRPILWRKRIGGLIKVLIEAGAPRQAAVDTARDIVGRCWTSPSPTAAWQEFLEAYPPVADAFGWPPRTAAA